MAWGYRAAVHSSFFDFPIPDIADFEFPTIHSLSVGRCSTQSSKTEWISDRPRHGRFVEDVQVTLNNPRSFPASLELPLDLRFSSLHQLNRFGVEQFLPSSRPKLIRHQKISQVLALVDKIYRQVRNPWRVFGNFNPGNCLILAIESFARNQIRI